MINTSGAVQERYGCNAYGAISFMTAAYGSRASSNYQWETLYGAFTVGIRRPGFTRCAIDLTFIRIALGRWINRDPDGYNDSVNLILTL